MNKQPFVSFGLALSFIACLQGTAWAYDEAVHDNMTAAAFDLAYPDSVQQLLQPLGIQPNQLFLSKSPRAWMIEGSKAEDDYLFTIPRPPFHFFDPITEKGLNDRTSSPDWAFNTNELNPTYSIPGARDSFYRALTNTDSIVREKQWRDTFRAVGQIAHLVQDMGQPQHVRNDRHLSPGAIENRVRPCLLPRSLSDQREPTQHDCCRECAGIICFARESNRSKYGWWGNRQGLPRNFCRQPAQSATML